MCYRMTHMTRSVGVRELRQNLSRYLERVKAGEGLIVTERGREVARLIPSGASADRYVELGQRLGATIPVGRLEDIAARLEAPGAPAGTTDAYLAETRHESR
jgi:prevent-host-death family protein